MTVGEAMQAVEDGRYCGMVHVILQDVDDLSPKDRLMLFRALSVMFNLKSGFRRRNADV